MYTSIFNIILYNLCAVAPLKHLGRLLSENYVYIVAFTLNLQRAFFHSIRVFFILQHCYQALTTRNSYKRVNTRMLLLALCLLWHANSSKATTPISTSDQNDHRCWLVQTGPHVPRNYSPRNLLSVTVRLVAVQSLVKRGRLQADHIHVCTDYVHYFRLTTKRKL
jgi:hypothetical protein